jgi:predicted DNA-binding ribbon-helix-helix protein
MKSQVVKRSILLAGHKTSVSLEDAFWKTFKEIATERDMTLSELATVIDSERHNKTTYHRPFASLCSASTAIRFPSARGAPERERSWPTPLSRLQSSN